MGACVEARADFLEAFGASASLEEVIMTIHDRKREDWEVWLLTRNSELTEFILKNGANVHAQNDYALSCAANAGNYELVRILLSHGADPRAGDSIAIFWAKKGGYDCVVGLLEEALNKKMLR
ncbi:MAG: putative ankyrin repeat protein [Parcubacteria group bacterium Gr01-1014_3]|nr:MAG: putative ankyrin repeat protein [Parcubacteria group bacterium Gr01-1014_3]